MEGRSDQVLVVLGCRVIKGKPGGTLERRLTRARWLSEQFPELPVIFSGGRRWEGTSESQAMSSWWQEQGTNAVTILEDHSLTTLENARKVAQICQQQGFSHIHLVTCEFHIPRASWLFKKMGLTVYPHPSPLPQELSLRLRLRFREGLARLWTPVEFLIK